VIALAIGGYYGFRSLNPASDGALKASGSIESTIVNVSPEMAGKVSEVLVSEGQPIKMGDPLLVLDSSLLSAQQDVAQTGVDSAHSALLTAQSAYNLAQAQYNAALTAARAQEGAQRLTDWSNRAPGVFGQPLWYFSQEEQIAAAKTGVESASKDLQQEQADLDGIIKDLSNAKFVEAETRLSNARVDYLIAKTVYDHAQLTGGKVRPDDVQVDLPPYAPAYRIKIAVAKTLSGDSDVLVAANDALDTAETELDDAQQAYDALLNTDASDRVLEARAKLSVAQERYEVSLDTLTRLQVGAYSPQVDIASKALDQAKAALDQAQNGVNTAEANLALLKAEVGKLTIYAPMDGTILARNVETGEFVQPGAVTFTMANLNELTITVYIPEDLYGRISLGQQAAVMVDSFPNETFTAEVILISDQAEYTPRNVQTVEGRSATVYAIKLKVTDNDSKLKIGMPADVVFK
jgi:HlyD family secretion protein